MKIYVDGGCAPNPGPGGWGWVTEDSTRMAYGGLEHSTNNYMELVAIKEALDTNTGNVTLLCDSQYAIAVCTRTCRPAPDHVDIKFEIINLMQGREVIFEKIESKKNEAHPLVVAGRQKAAKR